ncbi:hypothetical protein Xedl_03253 [Xenorhabdus eapokensis]|uniref:Uncharacterized protein n=1 Tax=Xenorhabdus eapokensis TaxID=1873482 RepID=A0A1Q5TK38_9GAMM|nr:hypothetical protein Xedl_03253 [Xenorhabdus eapokensis]
MLVVVIFQFLSAFSIFKYLMLTLTGSKNKLQKFIANLINVLININL